MRWSVVSLLALIGALAACCPPGVATSAAPEGPTSVAAATGAEAGRGYGFAMLGQATAGGGDSEAPGASAAGAGDSAEGGERAVFEARFESAWRLVAERYWNLDSLAVDWNEVGERYRAKLDEVDSEDELYALLEEMYEQLGDNHSVYVPPARVAEIRDSYGDLPCIAVFDSSATIRQPLLRALRAQAPNAVATDSSGPVEYGMTTAGGLDVGYVRL
ncbi:MAG TPA: hypothetical protein VFD39_04965, partial [Trueperaceae bacterium]|nr:hypothetical protein [Trueperaceae bacterium]